MAIAGNEIFDLSQVGRVSHKAESHPVDPLLQAEGEIRLVLVGEGTDRQLHIGEINPFVVGENPSNRDGAMQGLVSLINLINLHLDPTVIQKDATACGHLMGEPVVGHGCNGPITGHLAGGEAETVPLGQGDRSVEKTPKSNFRALQVLENADIDAQFGGNLADGGDSHSMLAVIAVGKVEAKGGRSGGDQLTQPLGRLGGGTDRGHDLGATHEIGLGHRHAFDRPKLPSALSQRWSAWI